MLTLTNKNKIYIASEPVDFRKSIDGLSQFIEDNQKAVVHDGSIYVFYNKNLDKIKCLFWDNNGFVLYYKRLDHTKFSVKSKLIESGKLTSKDLVLLLSGASQS